MTAVGSVYVEDVDAELLTYTSIRVYRGSTSDPTTAVFTAQVGSNIPLVSGTNEYPFTDASGNAATIWRTTFYNTVTLAESGYGPLIRVISSLTLRTLRYLGAQRAGAASGGLASDGSTSPATVVDPVLLDSGMDAHFMEGAWVYRPDAANASDKVRRIIKSGFNIATGALAFNRDYIVAPVANEAYQVFQYFPPTDQAGTTRSWDQIVRDALNGRWMIDQITLGFGDGHTLRYSLANFPDITESTLRRVLLRTTNSVGTITDQSAHTNGRFVTPVSNAGAFSVDIWPAPSSRQEIIVEALRQDSPMYVDTDTTILDQRRAECAVVVAAYSAIRAIQPGKYEAEYRAAIDELAAEEDIARPADMVIGL